jgi:hypothetical protein
VGIELTTIEAWVAPFTDEATQWAVQREWQLRWHAWRIWKPLGEEKGDGRGEG